MERMREAVAGPMPLRGLVRVVRAVVREEEVIGVLLMLEKAVAVVDLIRSGGFWRIREGRKGRWGPWVLGLSVGRWCEEWEWEEERCSMERAMWKLRAGEY